MYAIRSYYAFIALASVVRIEVVDKSDGKYEIGACFANIDEGLDRAHGLLESDGWLLVVV